MGVVKRATNKLISMNEGKNSYTAAVIKEKGERHRIYIKGKPSDVLNKCNEMAVK